MSNSMCMILWPVSLICWLCDALQHPAHAGGMAIACQSVMADSTLLPAVLPPEHHSVTSLTAPQCWPYAPGLLRGRGGRPREA